MTLGIASGGMKGITFVQAFQYWLKIVAIAVPALVLLAVRPPPAGVDRHRRGAADLRAPHRGRSSRRPRTITVHATVQVAASGTVDGVKRHGPSS